MADTTARIAELEADNSRLRRLLDQGGASGELRHRLRNTLAMLRTIIRSSAETRTDLDSYVAQLEDRLDALARAQAAADTHGWVDLHRLLADELQMYAAPEGERAFLSGPTVCLQPRPGQVFALALHELAVNAVEHGALGTDSGCIKVSWSVADKQSNPPLHFTWTETGVSGLKPPYRQGFGTEVLTRTLRYELDAETTFGFEADGFGCTITFPLTERIGRLGDS